MEKAGGYRPGSVFQGCDNTPQPGQLYKAQLSSRLQGVRIRAGMAAGTAGRSHHDPQAGGREAAAHWEWLKFF